MTGQSRGNAARWRRAWVVGAAVGLFVVAPVALWGGPRVYDRWAVRRALSADEATRQRGLWHIAEHAGGSARVTRYASDAMLDADNPMQRLAIRNALVDAGAFGDASPESREAWLDELVALTAGDDEEAEAYAWQELLAVAWDDQGSGGAAERVWGLMRGADDEAFGAMRRRADVAGLWSATRVPEDLWVRWFASRVESPAAGERVRVARALAAWETPESLEWLGALLRDDDAAVRLAALHAATIRYGAQPAGDKRAALLGEMKRREADDDPNVAAAARRVGAVLADAGPHPQPEVLVLGESALRAMARGDVLENRALAVWLLARELSADEAEALAADWLRDYDDRLKQAGALLAGLTGTALSTLDERELREDVGAVREVMRLGLWMAGRRQDARVEALLRIDNPLRPYAVIAALHREPTLAYDALLGPLEKPGDWVPMLLIRWSYLHVLNASLPADAPKIDRDAGIEAIVDRYESLRVWYRLHYAPMHTTE